MKYPKPAAPGVPMSRDQAFEWMEQIDSEKSLKEFIGELSSQGDLALAWAKGGDWETLADISKTAALSPTRCEIFSLPFCGERKSLTIGLRAVWCIFKVSAGHNLC